MLNFQHQQPVINFALSNALQAGFTPATFIQFCTNGTRLFIPFGGLFYLQVCDLLFLIEEIGIGWAQDGKLPEGGLSNVSTSLSFESIVNIYEALLGCLNRESVETPGEHVNPEAIRDYLEQFKALAETFNGK